VGEVAIDLGNFEHRDGGEMSDQAPLSLSSIRAGKQAVVVGFGKSGIAAAHLLNSREVKVTVSESSPLSSLDNDVVTELQALGVEIEAGCNREQLFTTADFIVVSPGVPLDIPCLEAGRRAGVPIIGEFGLACLFLKTPSIGITGTNGKSTVTALIGDMFKAAGKKVFVGGNIGIPLAEYVNGNQEDDVVVLEVSSFQLDTAGMFKPDVAVLLNITPDHLDRYSSYEEYVESKWSIFRNQDNRCFAIMNLDDPEIKQNQLRGERNMAANCFYFGKTIGDHPGTSLKGNQVLSSPGDSIPQEQYDLSATNLSEEPNRHNAMAAILAARLLGCSKEGVRKGLEQFTSLPHRLDLVGAMNGVEFFDDSKATNVGAAVSALESFEKPVILIAGGRGKEGGYEALAHAAEQKVRACVLIGETKEEMAEALSQVTLHYGAESMADAVLMAAELAKPGDVVLLSPACASFDMFGGYAERGEEFRKAVDKLGRRNKGGNGGNIFKDA